jgi:hypothetical protein
MTAEDSGAGGERGNALHAWNDHDSRAQQGGDTMPSFDQTPDAPQPFGFKILWFAVKAADLSNN